MKDLAHIQSINTAKKLFSQGPLDMLSELISRHRGDVFDRKVEQYTIDGNCIIKL